MIKNKVAFIETPNQCLFLNGVCSDIENVDIFLVKRKKWPVSQDLISNFFDGEISIINGVIAFAMLFYKRIKTSSVYIGSHLGYQNKLLVIVSIILNYRIYILDDGLYSVYYPNWLLFLMSFYKKLRWLSFYQRDNNHKSIQNYCLLPISNLNSKKEKFHNKIFLILSNFSLLGISESREKRLIKKAEKLASDNSMELVVLPHRRGRHELYKKMKLNLISMQHACFEHWYLDSNFENCMTIAYASSIWGVLEDNRTKNILVDLGLHTPFWIKERVYVSQTLKT